jgi:hypothetical protein
MDSLNKAKRRVKKNLKKGSKNEVPYAGTIETQQEFDSFVDVFGPLDLRQLAPSVLVLYILLITYNLYTIIYG